MQRSSERVVAALILSRALVEAIAFACLLVVANALSGGTTTVSLSATVAVLLGVSCTLIAVLRDLPGERRGGAIVAAVLLVCLVTAVLLPTRSLDTVGWIGRLIVFAAVGEAYLWRIVTLARGAVRWTDARNAAPFAVGALLLAAVAPAPLDRTTLPALSLALVAACGVALSLARATEELSLARASAAHGTRLSAVTSVLFAVGLAATGVALVAPLVEQVLGDVSPALAAAADAILFLVLLPLGYLAAFVLALLEPLFRNVDLSQLRRQIPQRTPEEEEALLREIERNRPLVVGGFEILIVLVLVGLGLVVLERILRERRLALPVGGELERSPVEPLGLGETLRGLFSPRAPRRRAPRDDGSPASTLRRLYWRFLSDADRSGHGWRIASETPDEHHRRVAGADPRWAAAAPLVSAFDELRYGERDPDGPTLLRARAALDVVEATIRT